jgi:hypothetical protein
VNENEIFDNSQATEEIDWNTWKSCHQVLMQIYPILRFKSCMHTDGKCVVNLVVENGILFDTGALGANYASQAFIARHCEYLSKAISSVEIEVHLASRDNIINTSKQAFITLKFNGKKKTYLYDGAFLIIDMENDFIIGLPAILNDLYDYFLEMLARARLEPAIAPHSQRAI